MPETIRQQEVGYLTVKLRARLPGEHYATAYAIQTFQLYWVEHIYGGFAYGDDLDYIERAWERVIKAVTEYIAEEGSKPPMLLPPKREEVQAHG